MIGIYCIKNNINGKVYIGQSKNIIKRFSEHKSSKGSRLLKNSFKKYGIENFTFDIILECEESFLDEYEIKLISLKNSIAPNGYNLSSGGNSRKKLSDISKKLISDKLFGRKLKPEYKKHLSDIRKHGNTKLSKKIKDKNGRVWGSIEDCIKETGMSRHLKAMLTGKRNKTQMFNEFEFCFADENDIITQFPEKRQICRTRRIKSLIDEKGNVFKTIEECSRFYNIPLLSRYLTGERKWPDDIKEYGIRYLTTDEIIKYGVDGLRNKGNSTRIVSNDGREWTSMKDCCEELGICVCSLFKWFKANRFPPHIECLGLQKK